MKYQVTLLSTTPSGGHGRQDVGVRPIAITYAHTKVCIAHQLELEESSNMKLLKQSNEIKIRAKRHETLKDIYAVTKLLKKSLRVATRDQQI